jgi:protein phosphatase 1 regulatory subunit 21
MAAASGDLAAKYQRLATEYAKLKAQIPVLKKAVIEEQTKASIMYLTM